MARSAVVTWIAGVLATFAVASGCDGERIKLGNGPLADGAACPHAQVPASQVLWIGDSWVLVPGNQHTDVRDRARTAKAIGPTDDYTIAAVAAAPMVPPTTTGGPLPIPEQYAQAETAADVKVLIMDGGTWDTFLTNGTSASVTSVASEFSQLLAQVASDGTVDQIVYYLMPELYGDGTSSIPGVAALRPLLLQACTQSKVPCHFLDLQSVWSGHPEYDTGSSPPVPTNAGGTAIADAIWSIMQTYCIAQ